MKKNAKRKKNRIWKRFLVWFWTWKRQPISLLPKLPMASQRVVDRNVWTDSSSYWNIPHAAFASVCIREVDKIK